MRKMPFLIRLLCGSLLFGGITVFANAEIVAKLTSQIFFWNNRQVELEAYNINGANYIKLRDAAELFGVNVEYYEDTNTVYLGESRKENAPKTMIDGNAYAKEDYSSKANPDIFNEIYTKEAYNAIRQSIVDIAEMTENANENGYNVDYEYAHFVDNGTGKTIESMKSVTATMFGYYNFSFGYEPIIKNLYEYPGYRICKVQIHKHFEPANKATENFVAEIKNLSDIEKAKRIADYICNRVVYKDEDVAGINSVFTETAPVNGLCGTYANSFVYLCQRADIPCIIVKDNVHAWNEVYVDGEWYVADISYYDVARNDAMLFQKTYVRTDINPQKTNFAKELLVPGSTE